MHWGVSSSVAIEQHHKYGAYAWPPLRLSYYRSKCTVVLLRQVVCTLFMEAFLHEQEVADAAARRRSRPLIPCQKTST